MVNKVKRITEILRRCGSLGADVCNGTMENVAEVCAECPNHEMMKSGSAMDCFKAWVEAADLIEQLSAELESTKNRVLTLEEINDDYIPTVIYVEIRDDDIVAAGVWQIDNYEMENNEVMDSPKDTVEQAESVGKYYGKHYRFWTGMPTDEERAAAPWEVEECD